MFDGDAHGMLAYLRANLALTVEHDAGKARAIAGEVLAHVPPEAPVGGVMAMRSLEGLALVAGGEVAEGMRRLDEAATAATSGEIRGALRMLARQVQVSGAMTRISSRSGTSTARTSPPARYSTVSVRSDVSEPDS